MGIRFYCPQGHKLNVKEFQAGRRGICPFCGEKILIPTQSSRPSSKEERQARRAGVEAMTIASIEPETPSGNATAESPSLAEQIAADQAQAASQNGLGKILNDIPRFREGEAPTEPLETPNYPVSSSARQEPRPPGITQANPDPLAESAEVVWYVRPPTGGQFGPATPEVIRGWLGEGRISGDTLVWREGWRDWREAAGVFPQLSLVLTNPLAALHIPTPTETIPQRTTPHSPAATRRPPNKIVWLIAGLSVLTLLAIVGVIWMLWWWK
jgi:hypothetical protein